MSTTDLRHHLQTIYETHQRLTPQLVVDIARDPQHPLHGRFEWDDRLAGEAWRKQQAHELIRTIRIAYKPDTAPSDTIRYYHAVRTEEGHVYHPADKIAQDPFLTKLVLTDMEREWQQLKTRYENFVEFWELVRKDSAA